MTSGANHPLYWRKADGGWQVRRFKHWTPLHAGAPMLHVNCFEAEPVRPGWDVACPAPPNGSTRPGRPVLLGVRAGNGRAMPSRPTPDLQPDPYRDYSQPWFRTHQELRGGGPVTDARLKRPGFRNFYLPHRRDAFAGFRTASV